MIDKTELEFYILTNPTVYHETENKKLLLYLNGEVEVIRNKIALYKGNLQTALKIYNSII